MVICGPTAVGKTNAALKLAAANNGSIISVDSRQMYVGLDIGSGKDIPADFTFKTSSSGIPKYSNGNIDIFGYDVFKPIKLKSPSQLAQKLHPVLEILDHKHKIPILVSGSGNYVRSLISPPETAMIPPNLQVRKELAEKTIDELQKILQRTDQKKLRSMNQSDRNNPRRLIRAIEVAKSPKHAVESQSNTNHFDVLWIGLTASKEVLQQRIVERVEDRIKQGVIEETQSLVREHPASVSLLQVTLGYQQVLAYLSGNISKVELQEKWALKEFQYAKRQLTWFKKNDRIHWFDIQDPGIDTAISNLLQSWNNVITNN